MKTCKKPLLRIAVLTLCLTIAWGGSGCGAERSEVAAPQPSPTFSQSQPAATAPSPTPTETPAPAKERPVPPSAPEKTPTADPLTCTLSISCQTVLDHMEDLAVEKTELIPSDGMLLGEMEVAFTEGETVFDILQRTTQAKKMHLEFVETPAYQSVYIEGIGNLYEFDCGELSGWTYSVNDVISSVGCSQVPVQDGDVLRWLYTCDLGADVGGPVS